MLGTNEKDNAWVAEKTKCGCLLPAASSALFFNEYKSCISSGNCSIKTSPALVSDTPLLLLSKSGVPTHSSRDCILRVASHILPQMLLKNSMFLSVLRSLQAMLVPGDADIA